MVYVDKMQASYGRMIMCHMLGDSVEELHTMADKIGIKRKWFQHKPGGTPHYDICLSKKALAIGFGAVEVDREKVVEIIQKFRRGSLQQMK